MVQHKDLMKFPLQFWLGLLCYCCGTQSTSILPVLLSLAVVEDTRATCPGVPIYIQEDMCRSHPSCPQPRLAYFYFEWIDLYHRTCHHCLSVCWWEWPGCFNLFKEWSWSLLLPPQVPWCCLLPGWAGQALPDLLHLCWPCFFTKTAHSPDWGSVLGRMIETHKGASTAAGSLLA